MRRHVRLKHPNKAVAVRPCLKCPFPQDRFGWNFITRKVSRLIHDDARRSARWSTNDAEQARALKRDTTGTRRSICIAVYERWRSLRHVDDAGGRVPRLLLRAHALFQLSLDRKDNTRPHFVDNATLDNLRFVALGINTSCNVVSRWGKHTCARLRHKVRASRNVAAHAIAARVQLSKRSRLPKTSPLHTPGRVALAVYQSTHRAYKRDPRARKQFGSWRVFFKHTQRLFAKQRAQCAISGIFMELGCGTHSPWKASLDAVDPKRGHVRGNLRWICVFLNSVNHSAKRRAAKHSRKPLSSVPTAWTPQLFQHYIGLTISS